MTAEQNPSADSTKGRPAHSATAEAAITSPTGGRDPQGRLAGESPGQRLLRRGLNASTAYMSAVLIVLLVIFSVLSPHGFASEGNLKNLVVDTSIFLVMAVGMTYVMVAAGFDLSIGSVLVFSGILSVKTMTAIGGDGFLTVLVGLIAAVVGGVVWGLFNGFCITVLRVPALITTLGTLGAALGVANLMTNGNDLTVSQNSIISLQTGSPLGLPWIVWVSVIVAIVGGAVLRYTRFGRHTYVIGSNEEAARRAGITVDRHLLKLYALSGALAGLAGMMSLIRFTSTTIGGHGNDALVVITGVILGGTSLFGGYGTMLGTVIGMFIPTILQSGLVVQNVQPFWQNVAVGFILIAAVYIDRLKRQSRDRS